MSSTAAARAGDCVASPTESVPAPLPDFESLYDDYADFAWRNARRLGVLPEALDDIVQEVFLVAHRRLSDVQCPQSLRAWMFSIVIRVVREHRRHLRRKDPAQRLGAAMLDPEQLADERPNSPHACAERADAVRLLHQLLSELDDDKREVFVLAELEEMTELEIAEVLRENVNTVHSRLRAARKAFELAAERQRSRDEWRLR
jgi:RNA polymerase sigma-70 factor (ECF subfamily)